MFEWSTDMDPVGSPGFVADNILNYEIVLASGEIVNANATSHSDLFLALKGGNNNFGVVTRFDVATFEHNQMIYGGLIIVPFDIIDSVLESLNIFTDDSAGFEPSTGLTVEVGLNGTTGDGQILLWLIDTNATGDHAALQPFLDMEPKLADQINTSLTVDYPSAVPSVSRLLMGDFTFVNDLEVIRGVQNITIGVVQAYSYIPDVTWDFQYEPLPRHVAEAGNARGGNIMGLNNTDEDLISKSTLWRLSSPILRVD
jgi:hypothetical protein